MEGFNKSEGVEKEEFKYHYTFTDNKVLGHPIIFECDANDDLSAEESFFEYIKSSNIDLTESEIVRGSVEN